MLFKVIVYVMIFHEFLEPNVHFMLKGYFDICDSFISASYPGTLRLYFMYYGCLTVSISHLVYDLAALVN